MKNLLAITLRPILWITIFLSVSLITAHAQDTILSVNFDTPTQKGDVSYALVDLDGMKQTEVITENDFIDGKRSFTGPLVREIIAAATDAQFVILTATNEYAVEVPVDDFERYPVILATRMDGKPLSVRDKGPIWLIYPMSDFAELRDNLYNSRLIWQVQKLEVR